MNRFGALVDRDELAHVLGQVAELLDVRWDRDPDLLPTPLSASQLRALFALERAEGTNLHSLARSMSSTPPSVSRLCDRLQAIGFIERATSPTSRREVHLRLTDQGRAYLDTLRQRREESLREIMDELGPNARGALLEGLLPLLRTLQPNDAETGQHARTHTA